jgi:hypothetical protein
MTEDDLPDSALTYTESLERDITRAETLAAHLQADLTEATARATQIEAALRAIVDAAIRDTTIGFDCLDSIHINEARALLDSGATPAGQEET